MRPFSILLVTLVVWSLTACGGGETTQTPPLIPTPPPADTGDKPDPPDPPWCNDAPCAENNQSCDEEDDECGGCLPGFFLPDGAEDGDPCISEADLEPTLAMLGVAIGPTFEVHEDLFCDNEVEVLVGAEQIGSKLLRLGVRSLKPDSVLGADEYWVLEHEPTETAPYHYSFTFDGYELTEEYALALQATQAEDLDEDEAVPPVWGPRLQGGEAFEITLLGLAPDEEGNLAGVADENGNVQIPMPTDARLIAAPMTYTMDRDAPTVTVTEPTGEFGTPTLTGVTKIAGTVTDDEEVARIEVEFQGALKAEIVPAEAAFSVPFDVEVDLRYEESSDFANLDVKAFDTCGHVASIVDEDGNTGITTKVIAWPWIRTFDHRRLPEDPQIRDSEIVDWDGDGYAEILFATSKGVYLLPNGADGEDLDENGWDPDAGTFPEVIQLTTPPTAFLAIADLDADGDMDLLTVQDEAGAKVLALHRREVLDEDTGQYDLVLTEIAPIPLSSTSQVRALLVADFNNTTEEYRREDVVIVTSGSGETLLLYKRYYDDEAPTIGGEEEDEDGEPVILNPILKEFDQCEDAEAIFTPDPDANADAEGGDVSGTTEYVCSNPDKADQQLIGTRCCPKLFGEPIKSGSVKEATYAEAIDVTGPDGVPDGLLDVVMGADQANYIYVWENRFWNTGLLDTAFSDSTVNGVYPLYDGGHKARYFCSGNIIEEGSPAGLEESCDPETNPDSFACEGHRDLIVGTEKSGTWRVLRGVGGGIFNNKKFVGVDPEEMEDVFDMSGTVNADVMGLVCDDLNQDGHVDMAILSSSARLMQVHLGNGTGRFNQVGSSRYMNPVNEGIGFVVGSPSQNLRSGDLNGDGYPDILMDYAKEGFGIFMNTTQVDPETEAPKFDLHATRTLVAPLGKGASSMAGTGGVLSAFTIGDITNDGKPDIVAVTDPNKSDAAKWLKDYHPTALTYRDWLYDGGKKPFANNIYIWTQQGHFSPDTPAFPSSYDRHPPGMFQPNAPEYGLVRPKRVEILDILPKQAQAPPGPDGNPDLILFGGAYGNPASAVAILANVTNLGFWDMDVALYYTDGTFRPHNGNADIPDIKSFAWLDPYQEGAIPSFMMGFPKEACDCGCAEINATARQCSWSKGKKCDPLDPEDTSLCPFWDCWTVMKCEDSWPAEIGGGVVAMGKTSLEEADAGLPTDDPYANGDVMVLNSDTGTMSILRWKGPDNNYPFEPSWEKSVGEKPVFMDLGDMDGDGIVDVAATVKDNVVVSFGQAGLEPLEAFLNVDKDPSVEHKGGVGELSLTDVNDDGRLDVVFLLTGYNKVVAYLGIGVDPDGQFTRQFHGPIYVPTCNQPSQLIVQDFNDDGCETLAVLCAGAGAVALFENDTCANKTAGDVSEE